MPELRIPETLQDSLMARLDALGPVKELAQLGSVLGREFTFDLLLKVSPMRREALERWLAEAVQEELFYQRGTPPEATYLFKHALLRDVAHQSLLRTTRQAHHRRVAETLLRRLPNTAATQPELVAYHLSEAEDVEGATEWWQRAGVRAAAQSAHRESIVHVRKALEQLARSPATAERDHREIDLQITLGTSLLATEGYSSPQVEPPYLRARELCGSIEDPERLGLVLWGLSTFHTTRGELEAGKELGEQLLELGEATGNPALLVNAEGQLAWILYNQGVFPASVRHARAAVEHYLPSQSPRIVAGYGHDLGIIHRLYLAWGLWVLGYPDQAAEHAQRGVERARSVSHPLTLAMVIAFAAHVRHMRGERHLAFDLSNETIDVGERYGFPLWAGLGRLFRGWSRPEESGALDDVRLGAAAAAATGNQAAAPQLMGILAETYLANGEHEDALGVVEAGLAIAAQRSMHLWDAELHRFKGELLLRLPGQSREEAEAEYHRAIEVARAQEAKAHELRAATSLARLWQQDGRSEEPARSSPRCAAGSPRAPTPGISRTRKPCWRRCRPRSSKRFRYVPQSGSTRAIPSSRHTLTGGSKCSK